MKLKTIFMGALVLSAAGYAAYNGAGLYEKKDRIDNFLAEYSARGVSITYDPINPLKLTNDNINIKNVVIRTDDISVSSEYMVFDETMFDTGSFNLVNSRFDSSSFSGVADNISLTDFSWNDMKKEVNVNFSGLQVDGSALDIPRGNGALIINQKGSDLRAVFSSLSDSGDALDADLSFKVKPDLVGPIHVGKSIKAGELAKATVKLRNVSIYESLQKKSPELDAEINALAIKMYSHHQPKSKIAGSKLYEFTQDKNRLSFTVEPQAPIQVSQLSKLTQADSFQLIEFLNLELEVPKG